MKCKYCGYSAIPDGSLYCNMCGKKINRIRTKEKTEIKVPDAKPLASGGYCIRIMVNGNAMRIKADTKEECVAKATAVKSGVISWKNRNMKTLGNIVDEYIDSNDKTLSPSTIRGYRTIRKTRFQNYMDKRLCDIKNWQKMINDESDVSPKTIRSAWALVRSSLEMAGEEIPKINLPMEEVKEHKYLNPEQIKIFVKAATETQYCIPILLGLHGLRKSEILAVKWENVDLQKDTIYVKGAFVRNEKNELVEKRTNKTQKSTREIPIVIPELKQALLSAERTNDYVVNCPPESIYKQIVKICKENDLPNIGVHGLRHSFASLAYHLGIPIETTCVWGGWKDGDVVRDIYTHLYDSDIVQQQNEMRKFYDF